ncbi:MAG: hypothetical protein JWM64_2265 [Frankiales bacterium]|nr:hypothetical protein [Frankiales bacterium]
MSQQNPFAVGVGAVPFGTPPPAVPALGPKPPWRYRVGASLLDGLLVVVPQYALLALAVLVGAQSHALEVLLRAVATVGAFAALVALYVRQGRTGGTYGKDLVGLRVLDVRTGEPIGTVPGVLRPVAHLADAVFFVGYLRPLWHKEGKTFADSMQKSVVVRSAPRPPLSGDRASRRLLLAVAVLQAVALIGATLLVQHRRDEAEARALPARVAQELAAPAPSAAPARRLASGDLEGRFLPAPTGFVRQSDSTSELGRLDAAGVARVSGTSGSDAEDAVAGLQLFGFRSALAHSWSGDGALYVVVVYEFKDASGAQRLVAASREGITGTFPSRTVPSALTYQDAGGGPTRQHGLFATGNHVYELGVVTPEPEPQHTLFDSLLKTQRERAEAT